MCLSGRERGPQGGAEGVKRRKADRLVENEAVKLNIQWWNAMGTATAKAAHAKEKGRLGLDANRHCWSDGNTSEYVSKAVPV